MFDVKDKNVLIVGLAQSGVSLVKLLTKMGAVVTVTDSKPEKDLGEHLADIASYKITLDLGGHNPKYIQGADLVILSPGVPTDLKALEPAKLKGTPITGELEFASQFIKEPIIAITGTNGKSTVTKLAYEFLKASGLKAWIGGNFGTPLSEYVLNEEKADALVVEVSSFQLETVSSFNPQQIALLNMAEDHLDRYKTMADYMTAKKRIFKNATRDVHAYLSADDSLVIEMAKDPFVQKARIHYFSTRVAYAEQIRKIGGAFVQDREIEVINSITGQSQKYATSRMKMRGKHSVENVLAALCLVQHYNINQEAVQKVIDTFPGLEHRLEYIRTKGGVQFYNDSKATNVHAVMRALDTFDEPMILIAGGKDKGIDFMPATDLIAAKVKNLILIGEAKERLNRTLGDYSETFIIGTFEEAVLLAYQKSRSGDVILLSPGCSSYDMFKDYEARGNYFKDLIKKL